MTTLVKEIISLDCTMEALRSDPGPEPDCSSEIYEELRVQREKLARLADAAPAMLEALKKALAWAEDPDCDSAMPLMQAQVIEASRAAIRKATEG